MLFSNHVINITKKFEKKKTLGGFSKIRMRNETKEEKGIKYYTLKKNIAFRGKRKQQNLRTICV